MDSINQTNTHFYPLQTSTPTLPYIHLKARSNSPQVEKQAIIEKIKFYIEEKEGAKARQQALQTNISDLRKLLQAAGNENDAYIKQVQEEGAMMADKAERLQAALKYSHLNGKHLQNCALFWKQYVQ